MQFKVFLIFNNKEISFSYFISFFSNKEHMNYPQDGDYIDMKLWKQFGRLHNTKNFILWIRRWKKRDKIIQSSNLMPYNESVSWETSDMTSISLSIDSMVTYC